MTVNLSDLDAHEQPPADLKSEFKKISQVKEQDILRNLRIDDPRASNPSSGFEKCGCISKAQIQEALSHLDIAEPEDAISDIPAFHHQLLPGLHIIPSLVSPSVQKTVIDRMVHRDLSIQQHQTNMHPHYDIIYPQEGSEAEQSFFSLQPDSFGHFSPKDAETHKPLSVRQVLQKRLHWVTLGGQYDWTNRIYPGDAPPDFPKDIGQFLESLFPRTSAQAAIVNFYSPGDTMMMHRDVSEETDRGLISLSFGCDGLFMIAPSTGPRQDFSMDGASTPFLLLRLQSGDAIYMSDESRFAWHGVPKILKGTCPDYLEEWPATSSKYEDWRGWMKNKRINLNVRQMKN